MNKWKNENFNDQICILFAIFFDICCFCLVALGHLQNKKKPVYSLIWLLYLTACVFFCFFFL